MSQHKNVNSFFGLAFRAEEKIYSRFGCLLVRHTHTHTQSYRSHWHWPERRTIQIPETRKMTCSTLPRQCVCGLTLYSIHTSHRNIVHQLQHHRSQWMRSKCLSPHRQHQHRHQTTNLRNVPSPIISPLLGFLGRRILASSSSPSLSSNKFLECQPHSCSMVLAHYKRNDVFASVYFASRNNDDG